MAQMTAAAAAVHLGPNDQQAAVLTRAHRVGQGRIEAWPAGPAVEFRRGAIERKRAAGAFEDALVMFVIEWARPWRLSRRLAKHLIALDAQHSSPIGRRSFDLEILRSRGEGA